jgi:Icc-related predicted phosphoesterase
VRRKNEVRLFFATDLHGSTLTFRKFLSAPRFYGAQVLVLGGDLTGKRVVPVVQTEGATATEQSTVEKLEREGSYIWSAARDSIEEFRADPAAERRVLDQLAIARVREWLERAERVLAETGTPCFVVGGNDDSEAVVDVLRSHRGAFVRFCEERVLELPGGYRIGGFGWSNPTPWRTPREASEDDLGARLAPLFDALEDCEKSILNIHVPPYGLLDTCPALDTSVDPPRPLVKGGQLLSASVGSTAVRERLLDAQPLLALCGHVHEARGALRLGDTLVMNPGSEYSDGVLRGAFIRVANARRPVTYQMTSG